MALESASKFRERLIGKKIKAKRVDLIYTVDKAVTPGLYADVLADKYKLPDETIITLKDGAVKISKLGDGKKPWSTSEALTVPAVEPAV